MKNVLQPANSSENTGLHNFFPNFSDNRILRASISRKYQKVSIVLAFMNSKLPDDWQISDKQYHIFQKSKSYEISNTDIYIGEDLEFIIHVFYWCIPLDHEIYTKCKKKHLT